MNIEPPSRTHLLIFCPLPPKPNGIADYFAEQLPYLARHYQCTVVIEDTHPDPVDVPKNVLVVRLREYLSRRADYAHARHLYHVGNNSDSRYLLPVLLTTPGIVVIHDLNLHHLIESQTNSDNSHSSYRDAVFQQYGRLGAIAGEKITDAELKRRLMTIDLPFNGSIIDSAQAVIVHSEYSRLQVNAYQPGKATDIPHHLSPITSKYSRSSAAQYRQDLGLPIDRIVIASMGFIAKAKQISAMLSALARLKKEGYEFLYILAGEEKPTEYDVSAEIRQYGLVNDVLVTGYLTEELFFKYMVASDLVANLRYPTGGETSGTFVRAMGVGMCCLIIDIGPFSEVPNHCVVKIPWGDEFSSDLENHLRDLFSDKTRIESIGSSARAWILDTHNINDTISEYSKVINRCSCPGQALMTRAWPAGSTLRYLPQRRIEEWKCENRHQISLSEHTGSCWWSNSLLQLAETDSKLIVIAEDRSGQPILQSLYDYQNNQLIFISIEEFVTMKHGLEFGQADSILAILPCDIFAFDPVEMFIRINWLSRLGSNVVISVLWNTSVEAEVELTTSAFREYLKAAGFIVEQVLDGPSDISFSSRIETDTNPEFCFKLRAASRMSDRFPLPYYHGDYSEAKLIRSDNLGSLINLPDASAATSVTASSPG